jgi:formylglycine-generating enzyme required for sulfatase activity
MHVPAQPTTETVTIAYPISLHLVRVPAGEFQMGSVAARDKHAQDNELPPHPVHLPEFHIGKYPVTNIQYQAFLQATGYRAPGHWQAGQIPPGTSNCPVVYVTWHDAVAFCDWLRAETRHPFRLPTEAEWEKAARGVDGRIYPWGDESPDKDRCNFGSHAGGTPTVGRYSPQGDSPYGCADMAGNVREWCQTLYWRYPYHAGDGREDLEAGGRRVLRGGAFSTIEWGVRCAYRFHLDPDVWNVSIGIRVVFAAGTSAP